MKMARAKALNKGLPSWIKVMLKRRLPPLTAPSPSIRTSQGIQGQRGCSFQPGAYDKAITDYNRAIIIEPRYSEAYHNRGSAYTIIGEYDKAIADFERAIDNNVAMYSIRASTRTALGNTA